jgi:uncharacterized membrane protein
MWGVIGLDATGLQIPILRQLIGFIYLTFIPGIIILRILKLHKLGNIETVLYTVGLSIATLMFTGLFMNTIYPFFDISGPISPTPLIITLSAVVLILCILSYVRDKEFSDPNYIDVGEVLSPPALFLCLIPFLSILGTYLVNFHHSNILLMFLIVIIATIVLLIAFDKFIPKNLYPLAIFVIAISLLFHNSLISMYIWGCDINKELYLTNLVKINGIWDPTMPGTITAMLSLVMLAPIYSIISDTSITWVFKIIYPLLFSLVPLCLYRVFQKQTDDKIAFLSCFFFMSVSVFYTDMLGLARQQIAELFLVLLILLMIDKNMDKTKRSFFYIVFGVSLAVSHYGLSYIYMFCLIAAWLILFSMDYPAIQQLRNNFYATRYRNKDFPRNPRSSNTENRTICSTFVLLFVVFTLTWYMYISSSSAFNTIVDIGGHIASSISAGFLNPEAAEGLEMLTAQAAPGLLHEVNRVILYLNQIFIVIGGIVLLLKHRELKFESEYTAFSILALGILFAGVSVPFFASSLNMTRLYQITVIFLAPFCIIGGITILRAMSRVVRASWTDQRVRSSLKVLSVYLVIFMLYQTAFIWEITDDNPYSISLSQDKLSAFHRLIHEQEMTGAEWLAVHRDNSISVYADRTTHAAAALWAYGFIPKGQVIGVHGEPKEIKENSYVYLSYVNVEWDALFILESGKYMLCSMHNSTYFQLVHNNKNKIYDNGGNIYR